MILQEWHGIRLVRTAGRQYVVRRGALVLHVAYDVQSAVAHWWRACGFD